MPDETHESGLNSHPMIDALLPSPREKDKLRTIGEEAPETVSGARDTPEEALANLLTALDNLGLITDSTTAS